jgi:predicted 2-oxoglutarate/Fe(II)-dependent dioxygenase YbiX
MVQLLNNHQHIYLFDNVLSDVECEYLQKVIDKYSNCEEKHGYQSNVQSKTIAVPELPYEKTGQRVVQLLEKITKDIFSKYKLGMSRVSDMEYPLLRKITGATRMHMDGIIVSSIIDMENKTLHLDNVRELSMIVALNSDYEGGELCFPDQNFEVKLKRGQVLLFPPYWTHPHKTNELKNDTVRYTVTTWLTCEHDYK